MVQVALLFGIGGSLQEIEWLQNRGILMKYEEISRSFLLGLKDTVLKVVRAVTPSVLTFGLGSILGNVRDIKMIWQKSGDGGMNLADMP